MHKFQQKKQKLRHKKQDNLPLVLCGLEVKITEGFLQKMVDDQIGFPTKINIVLNFHFLLLIRLSHLFCGI